MDGPTIFAFVLTIGLAGCLIAALLKPEKFS